MLLSCPDSLSGLFLALLGVYLFFTSFATKLHFFLGVFFHFITGDDTRNVHQVIISHVQEHSRKPNEARRRIEALMGDVPRVELFARRPAPGWDVWGNEVDSTIDWAPT